MKSTYEEWRKPVSIFVAFTWLFAGSIIESKWEYESPMRLILLALGFGFTGIGMVGRIWCLAYIAGHKSDDLVVEGPYSLCRNPLYFFSFVGAVGVGLGSCTISLPLLAMLAFGAYYPGVIASESGRLSTIHGEEYQAYRISTPAFLPSFMHYRESRAQWIETRAFRRGLFDTAWFIASFAILHIFAEMHDKNLLPTWLSIF